MRLTPLLLAAALLGGCVASESPAPSTPDAPARTHFVVALPPGISEDSVKEHGDDLERALEAALAQTGLRYDVVLEVPPTAAAAVEALKHGDIDAAMLSAWPAAVAASQAGADIVLAEQREVYVGKDPVVMSFYYSHYVVREDSPYTELSQLRGKDVAFTTRSSTSGYVFPLAQLVNAGLIPRAMGGAADADVFFDDVVFAGGYGQAWEALRDGRVDVAVIAGDVDPALYREVLNETRILATQGPVPSHAVVFRYGLGLHESAVLSDAFLALDAHAPTVRELGSATFVSFKPTTTDEHVRALSVALASTGLRLDGF